MARSVILSAVRSPFGKLGGSLADKEATELGSIVIRAALGMAFYGGARRRHGYSVLLA